MQGQGICWLCKRENCTETCEALQHAEAVAGLLCSLCVGWMAAGMQVWMVLEQAVTLMLVAGPDRAAAFLQLLLRGHFQRTLKCWEGHAWK